MFVLNELVAPGRPGIDIHQLADVDVHVVAEAIFGGVKRAGEHCERVDLERDPDRHVDHRHVEAQLVAEMVVHRGEVGAGLPADITDRDVLEAALREEPDRRIEQALPRGDSFAVSVVRPDRRAGAGAHVPCLTGRPSQRPPEQQRRDGHRRPP